MKTEWSRVVIREIQIAVYVPPNMGRTIHKNRPFHGFVIEASGDKDYHFVDGRVLHTEADTLFYLPKGSSYEVKTGQGGGCYAINFDADISDEPFAVHLKNADAIKKSFRRACDAWQAQEPSQHVAAMSALYEAIGVLLGESANRYMPNERYRLIDPAIEAIDQGFLQEELSVSHLASLCGISEVYLRKIFISRFGVPPKEYMIRRRMDYACHLLASGQLEVRAVAELCGYSEPCHFSREFKKRVGVPPKGYL